MHERPRTLGLQFAAVSADEVRPDSFPADRAAAIVACSPHGIVEADPATGSITWTNPSMAHMFGRELVGRSFTELHPPEAVPSVEAAFERIARGDLRPVRAVACRRADGTVFFCDIHPGEVESTTTGRLVAFFTEVTDRHMLHEQLLDAEAMSHQGSWELDHTTGTLSWSPEMHRVLGHDEDEPPPGIGWVLERVHPDDQEWVEGTFERSLATGESWTVEHRMELDDRSIWVRATGAHTLGADGRPLRSRGTLRDITAERERLQRERVADMLTTLGSITGDLAAEVGNLLSVIANAVELLRDDIVESEESDELVGLVDEACRRGHVLARRLVGLSSRRSLHVADVHVGEHLESMEPLLRTVTGSVAQLRFALSDGSLVARVDPDGLAAAVINLVSNARDSMIGRPGGEVVVEVSAVHLGEPGARDDGPPDDIPAGVYVRLDVVDGGHGIPDDTIDLVFGSFWSSKSDGRGTGLGLSMVRDFVVRVGGAVSMLSSPEGTRVSLWLPAGSSIS